MEDMDKAIVAALTEGLKAGNVFWGERLALGIRICISPFFVREEDQEGDLPEIQELVLMTEFTREDVEGVAEGKLSDIIDKIRKNLIIFLFGMAMKQGEQG